MKSHCHLFGYHLDFLVFVIASLWTISDQSPTCEHPPLIENSIIPYSETEDYKINTTIEFSCEFGYVPSDYRRTVTCVYVDEDTAEWTNPTFTCIPRPCGDPGYVSHARRNGSVFSFSSRVIYACEDGYKLVGSSQRFCQTNGKWSGILPSCEVIECPVPKHPEHGSVSYSSLEYGSELQYVCNKGFKIKGPKKDVCSRNGEWSGEETQCIESTCDYPEPPVHGGMDIVGERGNAGGIAIFSCKDGYQLFGSPTSKCLDTGEWTFPPPQCLEPCTVPSVENGIIGDYRKGYRNRRQFQQVNVGTVIENGAEWLLRCTSDKYEIPGSDSKEEKISCNNGQWSKDTKCVPASCREKPPTVPNARLITTEITHGTSLVYLCDTNFDKSVYGSTVCEYGKWKGSLPVCKDIHCSQRSLIFNGLKYSGKDKYGKNEIYIPQCLEGYEIAKPNDNKLVCVNSEWKGNLPPCKPAKCLQPPQQPNNGAVKRFEQYHGATAEVVCNSGFVLNGPALKCTLGQWSIPTKDMCKDVRCYLKTLKQNDGLDVSDEKPVMPGNYAHIKCLDGYEMKFGRPYCENQAWKLQNNQSPCQPKPCAVIRVTNGEMKYQFSYTKYNWGKIRYDTIIELRKEKVGVSYNNGSKIYLVCTKPFTFHGAFNVNRPFTTLECSKGKWMPQPLCLRPGSPIPVESATIAATSATLKSTLPAVLSSTISSLSIQPPKVEIENEETVIKDTQNRKQNIENETSITESEITTVDIIITTVASDLEENCSCIYPLQDDNVIAYSDSRRMHFGSEVKIGRTVRFFCNNVGFHHLHGVSELACENCKWHSSDFPTCAEPQDGDASIFIFTKNVEILTTDTEGTVIVPEGINMNVSCTIKNSNSWPTFKNISSDLPIEYRTFEENGKYDLWLDVIISHANSKYSGKYECISRGGHSNYLKILIMGQQCPDVVVSDSVIVTYSDKKQLNSKAFFLCSDPKMTLLGEQEITCLSTGLWSSNYPTCEYIQCPMLKPKVNMTISFSDGTNVDSEARYLCSKPFAVKGRKRSTCLSNGEWSSNVPDCEYVTCNLDVLMRKLPEDVVPNMDHVTGSNIPYGDTLVLQCMRDDFHTIGMKKVNCTKTGEWSVGNIICGPGCGFVLPSEGSELIVDPNKDVYRFGEFVTFSCPPGLQLNSTVERMMCLQNGWSEEIIPMCEDLFP